MNNMVSDEKISYTVTLYNDFTYPELKWILKQLRRSITNFTKSLKTSMPTMKSNGVPAFAVDRLIELCKSEVQFRVLRRIYSKRKYIMPKIEDSVELLELENLTLHLKYEEFRWILKEIRLPLTRFANDLQISPTTLQGFGDENKDLPLFVGIELIKVSRSEVKLLLLRRKYAQIHEKMPARVSN